MTATAAATTRRQTPDPDEDSTDRAADALGTVLDADSTGEWEAVIASLPQPAREEHPR